MPANEGPPSQKLNFIPISGRREIQNKIISIFIYI